MRVSQQCLNPEKTQLIWLGTRQQLEKLPATDILVLSASIRHLWVTQDSQLTMVDHTTTVCRAGVPIRQTTQLLTPIVAQMLLQAFIMQISAGLLQQVIA